jgi:hypothetical protein
MSFVAMDKAKRMPCFRIHVTTVFYLCYWKLSKAGTYIISGWSYPTDETAHGTEQPGSFLSSKARRYENVGEDDEDSE